MTSSKLPRLSNCAFLRYRYSILLALLFLGFVAFPLSRTALTAGSQKQKSSQQKGQKGQKGSLVISAAFTPGNLVVYRAGDGSAALGSGATAIFLDEYTPAGALVQAIPMPTAVSGANKRLTGAGSSTTEGMIARSADGAYITVGGYDAPIPTASVASTTSAAANRVVGRVDAAGTVDTTTALTDAFSGGNLRSVVSSDGSTFWMDGSNDGVRTTTLGSTTSTVVSSTQTNLRQINIFNGQLYVSSGAGTNTTRGVNKVGTGLPTNSGNTTSRLAGFTDTLAPSSEAFVILDNPNNAVNSIDTIYLADDTTSGTEGGLQKWTSTDGVNWTKAYRALSGTAAFRGVTGQYVGSTLSLFATTTDNRLVAVTDTGSALTFTTLATAASSTAFRGVAFAPTSGAATPTPTPTGTPTPSLSINDVTQAEGNAGTTNFTFTVSLSSPAQTGGVSFTVNTADGTTNPANAGSDYVAIVGGSGSIPEGSSSTQVVVQVNGDATTEPNETFFVNISGVTGAGVTDGQGLGTITNDDVTLMAIYTIQGSGMSSPFTGQSVTTTGVVTGRRSFGASNFGFYIQDPTGDGNVNTSDAVLVFTGSTVPTVSVGDSVQVTGTISEFEPSTTDEPDGVSPPDPKTATELTGPTISVLSSGNPLPAAVTQTIFDPAATSRGAELEKYEYMRVSVTSLTVSEPTNNNFGEFWGVATSTPRPFREPGIEAGDPVPVADDGPFAGATPPNVPRFDGNFERIMVDSGAALTATGSTRRTQIFVTTGAVVTGIVGPLDYTFDQYRIVLDYNVTPGVTPGITAAVPAPTPTAQEFTISHANLENFSSSNATKLNKASLAIRNVLRTPDILGIIEVDTAASATALANKVNADVGNPSAVNYVAYFSETSASQDIGYLVNSARVTVVGSPTQYHVGTTFTYCGTTDTLHDRPSFVLTATVPQPGGGTFPVTVILNHTKSLIGVDSPRPFGTGLPCTEGARNREKRRQQAEDIADLIQTHSAENLVVLGDLNAFDFSDGLGDVVGTLKGTPPPADQVVEPSTDRWTYQLTNLINKLPADQRYSFAFEGNAQALDHVLVNNQMLARNTRFVYGRYNGDFSNDFATDANRPERVADHDAPVAFFGLAPSTLPGQLIISEFRTFGPTGTCDEFVEVYNNTNSPITVQTLDGSAGFALALSGGNVVFTIPNGTLIPARGHYLAVNNGGGGCTGSYSLGTYPAGNGTTATGNTTMNENIVENVGIALFNTSNQANFNSTNRLDAVGSSTEANTLYKEGTGYPAITVNPIEHSFYRNLASGYPQDTDNNATDFLFVDTNGTPTAAGQRLGAPGPENLSSPIFRGDKIKSMLLDSTVPSSLPPNRVRDFTSDPPNNSTFGTIEFRRRFVNNTGGAVTRLRFRIVDVTTFPEQSTSPGTADLRARTSTSVSVSLINDPGTCPGGITPCTVTVQGTTLETPPAQPNGGGFNSTLSAVTVTTGTPLAPGASINVRFLMGLQSTGTFRFFIIVEALP